MKGYRMIKNMEKGKIFLGDSRESLKECPDNSIDCIVTDPPYGMKCVNEKWDKKLPPVETWKECHRVLKPGAFAFIMSSVRQNLMSRMILNLEEAGFETAFSPIFWTYKNGFPKARNTGIAIDRRLGVKSEVIETRVQEKCKYKENREQVQEEDGEFSAPPRFEYTIKVPASQHGKEFRDAYSGFQPRPAVEAILVVMKPRTGKTYVGQAMRNGKGVTYLNNCRIPFVDSKNELQSRFMSNLITTDNSLDLNDDQEEINIECRASSGNSYRFSLDAWAKHTLPHLMVEKPSKKEKELGLDSLPDGNIVNRKPGQLSFNTPMYARPFDRKNTHPTVKPLKLMAYLVALSSRSGDIVLDPFCGSGTTCVAAYLLGRKFLGIEIDKEYHKIAGTRLREIITNTKPTEVPPMPLPAVNLEEVSSIKIKRNGSLADMEEGELGKMMEHIINSPVEKGTHTYGDFKITTEMIEDEVTTTE
jgi:site-specific DNA-methyltransferase (adenine-specific)